MRRETTPEGLAVELARVGQRIREGAFAGIRRAEDILLDEAISLSSGTMTAKQMRAADHPFARRHGSPNVPLLPINVRSGEFRESWVADVPRQEGDAVVGGIANVSEHGGFLEQKRGPGRSTMFARPLREAVEQNTAEAVQKAIDEELTRALGG